jgi:hypothetical protein
MTYTMPICVLQPEVEYGVQELIQSRKTISWNRAAYCHDLNASLSGVSIKKIKVCTE